MDMTEIKTLLDEQGKAFDAFKQTHEELKKADVLTSEKLSRIEAALDKAVEGKAAIDAAFAAEAKEREELEAKFNRMNLTGVPEEKAKQMVELRSFNRTLGANAAARRQAFTDLDVAGYAAYKSAVEHYLREGKDAMTPEEVKTLSVGSDPDGGYFVTPDMTGRAVKKIYETSPVRQIASAQTISVDTLEGIEDLGEAGAGYAGEQAQGSDTTTPQVGKWSIPVFWIDTEPKATQQVLDDADNVEAWLAGKVGNKLGRFENSEFINGTAKIRGFVGGYTAASDSGSGVTWGQIGYTATGVSGDFAATGSAPGDAIHSIVGLLKNDYLDNAKFVTRRAVITKIRKLKDGQGNYLWQPSFVMGQPESLVGYPVVRAEDMPALAANSYSLAFGDFAQAYQIVDRMGIRVLRDPYTSKPFIKFYTTKRVGGGVVNFEAIKLLKFG
jgi:HK97 family phage major capsid protein